MRKGESRRTLSALKSAISEHYSITILVPHASVYGLTASTDQKDFWQNKLPHSWADQYWIDEEIKKKKKEKKWLMKTSWWPHWLKMKMKKCRMAANLVRARVLIAQQKEATGSCTTSLLFFLLVFFLLLNRKINWKCNCVYNWSDENGSTNWLSTDWCCTSWVYLRLSTSTSNFFGGRWWW